ncbi:MAG: hypothetical protein U0790_10965 [Isosphaeraceae bacterium]
MSHEDAASRSLRETSRRRVKFQAVLEDLEGRVLLSASPARLRAQQAQVRLARMQRPRPMALRQLRLAGYRQGQTINVTPAINIQNSVTPPTATATVQPTPSTTPATTSTQSIQAMTPQGSMSQSWPANVSSPSTAKPSGSTTTPASSNQNSTTTPAPTTGQPTSTTPPASTTTPSTPSTTTPPATSNPPATTPATPTPPAPTPPSFAEGTLLLNAQTGEIAQYGGGVRHLISPPVATKMGLSQNQLTAIAADKFNLIPSGQDYYPDGMFVRNVQNGEISQYSGGSFHWVSVPVATKLGLTGNDVATVTAEQYNKVSKGSDYFPEGMLIQNVQTGEINLYSGGQRHWISVPVASKMNLSVSKVTTISASQFNRVAQGKDYFPEGAYLQNQVTGEIAQYSNGQNHVVSAPVAVVMGLTPAQWISVAPSQYDSISKGNFYYPEGIFIQNNQSSEVSQVAGGQRHWVSSEAALAIGLTSAKVAAIGADQYNAIPRGGDFQVPQAQNPAQA